MPCTAPRKSKAQQIRDALTQGDHIAALRIAAHFHDRSPATITYKRGMDAYNNPRFYRQVGKDPEILTRYAIAILLKHFPLEER
jgi:hypothetical protein